MSYWESLFSIGNTLVLPFWVLLIFFPHSRWTERIFEARRLSPSHLFAFIYGLLAVPALIANPAGVSVLINPTLAGVQNLLGSPAGAAAGWVHYLCFDLFVGASVWRAAREGRKRFLWVSPLLFLILMLGPLGWLLFQAASALTSRSQRLSN